MSKPSFVTLAVLAAAVLVYPHGASAQQYVSSPRTQASSSQESNVPGGAQNAASGLQNAVKKYRIGADGGIGLDPEIIIFGAHGYFGPLFKSNVNFRPAFELGFGELTTMLAFDLDAIFTVKEPQGSETWTPYFGIGPNFALSHQGFSTENGTIETTNNGTTTESTGRFDFGDTTFDTGLNFIVGMRRSNGLFTEMKATAYGVANIRLMVGWDF